MYCPHCGKEVIEGAGFCAHCGNTVTPTAQVPQYTLTFVRYDADGPTLTITMSTGESTTLADRDRQSISLPSGTYKFALDAGTQHAEQEISLDADSQINLYWNGGENCFEIIVGTSPTELKAECSETPSGVCCPRCGSHNVQYAPVTAVNSSGYSCCTGCCGGLLLGPLGLLLGMCGMGTKSTTTVSWMCNNCGRQFVTAEQAEKQCRTNAALGTFFNVVGLLFLGVFIFSPFGWIIGGLSLLCGCISVYSALYPEATTGHHVEALIPDTEAWKKTYIIIHAVALTAAVLLAIFVLCSQA